MIWVWILLLLRGALRVMAAGGFSCHTWCSYTFFITLIQIFKLYPEQGRFVLQETDEVVLSAQTLGVAEQRDLMERRHRTAVLTQDMYNVQRKKLAPTHSISAGQPCLYITTSWLQHIWFQPVNLAPTSLPVCSNVFDFSQSTSPLHHYRFAPTYLISASQPRPYITTGSLQRIWFQSVNLAPISLRVRSNVFDFSQTTLPQSPTSSCNYVINFFTACIHNL